MRLILILCIFTFFQNLLLAQCDIGDPCMQGDPTCYTNSYSYIENEFVNAGVQGGIPQNLPVVLTISGGDDLQTAIDNVHSSGGGVIVLNSGNYDINNTVNMKSNVVLRGASQTGTKLRCYMRSTWAQGKKQAITFNNCQYAGIENLTYEFMVIGCTIPNTFDNDPCGLNDLYVQGIYLNPGTSNSWVQDTRILKSGTDPIYIRGNNNTFRRNFVDQTYNKGVSGNGYYDIRGDNNLFYQEDVNRIRHFSLHLGAQYNVVYQCNFTVDINFHNGDDGYNLIEQNTITIPSYHNWNIFATGGAQYGHQPPGPNNIIVNSTTDYKGWQSPFSDPNTIYTFTTYGDPSATNWAMPPCNTFYPMIACPSVLECSSRINYGAWVNDGNCTIEVCEGANNVTLRTQPDLPSKSWTGPNGFTATNDWARLDNITPAMAGTYTLTSSDGTCTYTTEFELVVGSANPVCEYNANATGWVGNDCSPAPLCEGEQIILSVTPNNLNQSWTGPNGFTATGDATLSNLKTNMSGTYTVTASDPNTACTNTISIDVLVENCLPNIVDGCYYMQFKHSGKYVTNTGGYGNNGNTNLTFYNLPSGQYHVVLRHRNHLGVMSNMTVTVP